MTTHLRTPRYADPAWVALLVFECVVGASSFALTFHGLRGYGQTVAHLGGLAWCVPVAIDGATLAAIVVTFLLAHAPRKVRVYAWAVFLFTNALSVAGNVAYALRPLPPWTVAIAAAAWPMLVTLIAHLGIVTWRHRTPPPVSGVVEIVEVEAVPPVVAAPATPPAAPEPKPAVVRASDKVQRPAKPSSQDRPAAVQRVVVGGESMRSVAKTVGVSEGAIRQWVKEHRAADTGNGHSLLPKPPGVGV